MSEHDPVNREVENSHKWCGTCKQHKHVYEFSKNSAKKDGLQERCKECRSIHYVRSGYKEKAYEGRILRKYSLSINALKEMEQRQNYSCAICRRQDAKLFVDHCHSTGQVRGLLCHFCNTAIGLLQDDTDILASAIAYLLESKKHE